MSEITDPDVLVFAVTGETAWEGFDDAHVIFQRACPDCDHGLLLSPARFHGACGGSGFLTRTLSREAMREYVEEEN